VLVIPGLEVERPYDYYPDFLSKEDADFFRDKLLETLPWGHIPQYILGGEYRNLTLEDVWFGKNPHTVAAKCDVMPPIEWTPEVLKIKKRVEEQLGTTFNSVLVNLYRDKDNSIGLHNDKEAEGSWKHPIASVSLGAERRFKIVQGLKKNGPVLCKEPLEHGSLAVMPAGFQAEHLHGIMKEDSPCGFRINLTFRYVEENPSVGTKLKYAPHGDAYKPPYVTIGGYNGYHVMSALQKCIRRGLEQDALFWAQEWWASCNQTGREHLWHRLRVIASEDVGLADNDACVRVSALYANFTRRPNEKIFLWHAALLLARAPKSRIVDHAGIAIGKGPRPRRQVPPFALDNHAGGKMNWSESFKLEGCTLDDPYEAIAREICEKEEEGK
jgi:alkylated DNA repair dioxygenase AlkB